MSYGTVNQAQWFEAANDVGISRHAFKRTNQRGIQLKGLHLVLEFGEPVDDGYLMTQGALNEAYKELGRQGRKKDIQHLGRLSNIAAIVEQGVVVTAYRADKKRARRLMAGHVEAA